jgi:hypothetical protein
MCNFIDCCIRWRTNKLYYILFYSKLPTSRKEYVHICILFFLYILGGSCIFYRGGQANFFPVFKSQIRKFLVSVRYPKSAIFLGVPVSKSQIRKFL